MIRALSTHGTQSPDGITLLEVLISCGLLIMGLSTIAALLPAAGARLNEATTEDRAALLLSNAAAEISNRGLAAADAFLMSGTTVPARMLAFGKVLESLSTSDDTSIGKHFARLSPDGEVRRGSSRTFLLEDAILYDPPLPLSDTPLNAFDRDGVGLGPRKFREGICWGATIAMSGTGPSKPPKSGDRATLSIAVFKRAEKTEDGSPAGAVPIALKRDGSFYEADAASMESLLRGCSWVLAIPPNSDRAPKWFKIMSSWPWPPGPTRTIDTKTRVILENQEDFANLTATTLTTGTATVLAFEGILKVDEQVVTLD